MFGEEIKQHLHRTFDSTGNVFPLGSIDKRFERRNLE
jgi:hypothetical protein